MKRGFGRGGGRRFRATAAVAVSALALAGCGVQSTGMHMVVGTPVTLPTPGPSASASSTHGAFPVRIFLISRGMMVPVVRYLDVPPNPLSIIAELTRPLTQDETTNGYTNLVPADLSLKPSSRYDHEYVGGSSQPVPVPARLQIACSLDVYWLLNPGGGRTASTQLVINNVSSGFDDCPNYAPAAAAEPLDTPTPPAAAGMLITKPSPSGGVPATKKP